MAKFKIGNKVIDWYGRTGCVIDIQRFHVNHPKGEKRTYIKYLVKWDKPTLFNTWVALDADKLTKIPKESQKPQHTYHTLLFTADSGNKITLAICVVGSKHAFVGFSVCHEDDDFSCDIGEELAKFRAKKYPYKYFFDRKDIEEKIKDIQNECMEELKKNWKNPQTNIVVCDDMELDLL